MELFAFLFGAWASTALHELAHLVAYRAAGLPVRAVGTGWPPILFRWRVRGIVVWVGGGSAFSGLMVPGDGSVPARLRPFVSGAGPAANLALAVALLLAPGPFPLWRQGLVAFNLWCFLANAIPRRARGGNDGAHVADALTGAVATPDLGWLASLAHLYGAIGLGAESARLRAVLAIQLATYGLPKAATREMAASGAEGSLRTLLDACVASASGEDATARFVDALAAPDLPDWARPIARFGIAGAHGRWGEAGSVHPALDAAPAAERARLADLVDLAHAARAGDARRASRAAGRLGPLTWAGEALLADAWALDGDPREARRRAEEAAKAAERMYTALPEPWRDELLESLGPLRALFARLAPDDPELAHRLLPPPTPDGLGQILWLIALFTGAIVFAASAAATVLARTLATPAGPVLLATCVGFLVLFRYAGLGNGNRTPGGRSASVGVFAGVLLSGWMAFQLGF